MNRIAFTFYIYDKNSVMPLNINHYYCLKSQIVVNNLDKLIIFSNNIEALYQYDNIIQLLNEFPNKIELSHVDRVTSYKGNSILNPTQETDILRLIKLIELGGLYIDMDVLAVTPLRDTMWDTQVAIQAPENYRGEIHGLGSAVILAPENSEWCKLLLSRYNNYDENIKKGLYELIIYEPYRLALINMDKINVIKTEKFFPMHYYYDECEKFFFLDRFDEFIRKRPYMIHLWENRNKGVMKYLSENYFSECNTTYTKLIKKIFSDGKGINVSNSNS